MKGPALRRYWRLAVRTGSIGAAVLTAHSLVNLRLLRRPSDRPPPVTERVSVLLPVRNEAEHVAGCITTLRGQQRVADLEILVLDDGSEDGTAALANRLAAADQRVRVLPGRPLPPGWLGKPHACQQLADAATGSVFVFVDADVRFSPSAVAAAVQLLREHRLDLVSPYPRQLAVTATERLIQPLLQWSWLTTLPVRAAERSGRASMAAANGQFLVVDAAAYRRAGGHAAIRAEVLDDIALLRGVMSSGGRGGMADGTTLATCRMYTSGADVRAGYRKSLWSAFGSSAGAAGALAALGLIYVVPPVAALTGSATGVAGYLAAVTGRYAVARRTGSRTLPDVLAHPAAIAALAGLTASSIRGHRRGDLTWRGRPITPGSAAVSASDSSSSPGGG